MKTYLLIIGINLLILQIMAGIYVHIPFCKRKCIYCDFYSVASSSLLMEEYVFSLIREFDVRKGEIVGHDINTIYLGGGTPSLLPVGLLQRLARHIGVGKVEESTIEMNPDDVTADYAQEIASMGFNRVSIGVQSFDDGELRFLNRRHDADGAIKAVELLRNAPPKVQRVAALKLLIALEQKSFEGVEI